ncbi:hypothetical protein K3495_g2730 [Podosphaera aphanis]|nr:hypothetical protein K3495_g2730 [Podosphaera aphanis]
MPKFTKSFGRRKVTAPPEELVDGPAPVVESSFKVFDRAERAGRNFDGGVKFSRAPPSSGRPTIMPVPSEDDNLFENMSRSNHSGSSNKLTSMTNTSSRLSATSTASSVPDNYNGQHDWSSPHDKPFTDIPPPPVPRSSTGFTLKSAGRAMSWGKQKPVMTKELPPSPTISEDEGVNRRSRAVTTSSYASTTILPRHDEKDLNLGLGGDFSEMFSGFGKRSPSPAAIPDTREKYSDSYSTPPSRACPDPLNLDKSKGNETAPCTSGGQRSSEALLSGASPPPVGSGNSPNLPQAPQQEMIRATSPASSITSSLKSLRATDEQSNRSSINRARRKTNDYHKSHGERDMKSSRDSENLTRRKNEPSDKIRENWAAAIAPSHRTEDLPSWAPEIIETLPQVNIARGKLSDENMFDSTIVARANLAQRFQEQPVSPLRSQTAPTKVMTPAQFERYKQDQERLRTIGGKMQDDGDEDNEAYDDDEDDIEKAKAVAKQRRKQEAHMAVYRQQMMKVIGETSGPSERPSMFTSQSSPNLANLGLPEENEEEDEEVPLGILQAHGFPSKNKPPMRSAGSNPNLKSAANATAGSLADPRLPVFARNLPHDPYYGSGIVNPIQRESLAFSGGSSASSGAGRGLPPGGLVGVIATEERSRAMRRGSPNPQGEFPSQLPPNNMGTSQFLSGPPNNVYSGINPPPGSLLNPLGPPPGSLLNPTNPPMSMLAPNQAQLQMTRQMNQFMQMQMNFMQMMAQGGQQAGQQTQPIPPEIPRPASAQMHQRSLTMMNQNSTPWLNRISVYTPSINGGNGYAASIAPSERSNIGLPGRYRPVSQLPIPTLEKPRASSMCVSLQNWDNKISTGPSTGIKVVNSNANSANISDEDEDEAWANLAKKKNERKSIWKTKKERDSNGLKEMLGYSS